MRPPHWHRTNGVGFGLPAGRYSQRRPAMAGMAGLEPTNEGVKVPCLSAWLHPYKNTLRRYPTTQGKKRRWRLYETQTPMVKPHTAIRYLIPGTHQTSAACGLWRRMKDSNLHRCYSDGLANRCLAVRLIRHIWAAKPPRAIFLDYIPLKPIIALGGSRTRTPSRGVQPPRTRLRAYVRYAEIGGHSAPCSSY